MIDIMGISEGAGGDFRLFDAQTVKAANVFSVQIGVLEYAPDFGIDLEFFLNPDFQFQNESFKAYLIQRLSEHHVNVNQVIESLESLYLQFGFTVGDNKSDNSGGGFIK